VSTAEPENYGQCVTTRPVRALQLVTVTSVTTRPVRALQLVTVTSVTTRPVRALQLVTAVILYNVGIFINSYTIQCFG
jgi:hypothetical protein